MEEDFEYYRIHRKNDNSIPLLTSDIGNPDYFYQDNAIENPELMLFKFGKPVPRNPKIADYHSTPNSVISKKLFLILNGIKINGIQLIPARIRGINDEVFDEYWAIHVYNSIRCIDLTLSDCQFDSTGISQANKVKLDKEMLSKISLEARLIFRLEEDFSYQIYHISIVNEIMRSNPTGIRFTNIENWNESSLFLN